MLNSTTLLLIFFLNGLVLSKAEQCDFTLHIHSETKVCTDVSCRDDPFGLFTILTGGRVCFIGNGLSLKIHAQQSYIDTVYKEYYYACDFNISIQTVYHCLHAGGCTDQCVPSQLTTSAGNPKPKSPRSIKKYSGCIPQDLCDDYCLANLNSRCGWALAELERKKCYKVYTPVSSQWALVLKIEDGQKVDTIRLTQSEPFTTEPIPIIVNSVISPTEILSRASELIDLGGEFVFVDACPLNFPTVGRVGEYQMSLDQATETYPLSEITFLSSGCETQVNAPDSVISRLLDYEHGRNKTLSTPLSVSYIPGTGVISTRKELVGSFTLTALNKAAGAIQLHKPQCKIEILSAVGCTGCKENPTVTLRSAFLKNPGIIEIDSNCTFEHKYLKCQEHPYNIRPIGSPDCCEIRSRRKGDNDKLGNITFCIRYEFEGSLTPYGLLTVSDGGNGIREAMSLMINNPSFLSGFLFTGSMIGAVSIAVKGFAIYLGNKSVKTLSNPNEK
ncbi:MAG: hypothetical protein FMLXV2_gp5 [Fushun monolepta lauta xinmovirus 2]|uniref:Glycoprotein n=1 Tax=Fushun monolepta lauta xinmovirus 2 TaxID=2905555 RepID=A0A8K1XFI0_9MONO|nr:MAG: hypothetical protein FMLXV2_gp5 [Fushun monolepta lauta xinmovirus 2]